MVCAGNTCVWAGEVAYAPLGLDQILVAIDL